MSPVKIRIMLAYYANASPHEELGKSDAVIIGVRDLIDEGLLMCPSVDQYAVLTDAGTAYVKALIALPVPVKRVIWKIPEFAFEMPGE